MHQQIARYVFAASNHGPKRSLHWWSTGSGKSAAIVSWLAGRVEKPAEDIVLNISLRRARILDKHPPLNLIILTKSGLLEDVVKDMWAFFWRNDDLLRHVIAQSGKLSSKEINAYLEDNRDVIINDLTRTDWGQYLWEVMLETSDDFARVVVREELKLKPQAKLSPSDFEQVRSLVRTKRRKLVPLLIKGNKLNKHLRVAAIVEMLVRILVEQNASSPVFPCGKNRRRGRRRHR